MSKDRFGRLHCTRWRDSKYFESIRDQEGVGEFKRSAKEKRIGIRGKNLFDAVEIDAIDAPESRGIDCAVRTAK
jgi:hypothetical protein